MHMGHGTILISDQVELYKAYVELMIFCIMRIVLCNLVAAHGPMPIELGKNTATGVL